MTYVCLSSHNCLCLKFPGNLTLFVSVCSRLFGAGLSGCIWLTVESNLCETPCSQPGWRVSWMLCVLARLWCGCTIIPACSTVVLLHVCSLQLHLPFPATQFFACCFARIRLFCGEPSRDLVPPWCLCFVLDYEVQPFYVMRSAEDSPGVCVLRKCELEWD